MLLLLVEKFNTSLTPEDTAPENETSRIGKEIEDRDGIGAFLAHLNVVKFVKNLFDGLS